MRNTIYSSFFCFCSQQFKSDSGVAENPDHSFSEQELVRIFSRNYNNIDRKSFGYLLQFSIYLQYWRPQAIDYKETFVGHCNTTTDIKEANFFGNDGNYVIAG